MHQQKPPYLLIIALWLLTLSACAGLRGVRGMETWRSEAPLTIPYAIRMQWFEKGNLIPNPSFETPEAPLPGDMGTQRPAHWEMIGDTVAWVERGDPDDGGDTDESGRHAIRIQRRAAGELDQPEGVLSDYIPVIPGNYWFACDVKLKNVSTGRVRLGERLGDAVTIRTAFFDKDRKPLDSAMVNPVSGTPIDSANKGYGFANFWRIEDLPWCTVRCRTFNYPYSEGDIPDDARYVRLFFGLKGTGSLWVDNIVFRYSKWNFTALERMRPYFGTEPSWENRLLPTPKQLEPSGDVVWWETGSGAPRAPVILVPENPATAERTAADTLREKIASVLERMHPGVAPEQMPNVRTTASLEDLDTVRLVFSIGKNRLFEQRRPAIPISAPGGEDDAYVIHTQPMDDAVAVYLIGKSPAGTYNAAATAAQLLEEASGVYHGATVVDCPDFLGRPFRLRSWRGQEEIDTDLVRMDEMRRYKLNKVYVQFNRPDRKWHDPDPLYREGVRAVGRRCRESGVMHLAAMVNPYAHFPFGPAAESLDPASRYQWTHDSAESLGTLKDAFRIGLDAGADTVMLHADDFVPHTGSNSMHFDLYTAEDRLRFVNLQNAHAHIINELKIWVDRDYPGTRIEFCPPWYNNEFVDRSEGRGDAYLRELGLQMPPEVAVVWTGPTVRSLAIDRVDLHRYRKSIGRWPMLWDNTLYARNLEARRYGGYPTHYPGKVRMCSLFEPYDTYRPEHFKEFNDGQHMYANYGPHDEIATIKMATLADYLWNTAACVPERSLWKALCRSYGPDCARELILFSDAYYGAYEMWLRMEQDGVTEARMRLGKTYIADMEALLSRIEDRLPALHPLSGELASYIARQRERLTRLPAAPLR